MNISADQAKALIDGATPGPWGLLYRDTHPTAIPTNVVVGEDEEALSTYDDGLGGDPDWLNPSGNLPLAAAAPDLAQTVIDQAEQIEKLQDLAGRFEDFLERFYRDFAKALGREDLLGAAEDGSEDDGETIYQLARDTLHIAHEARRTDQ